MRINTLVMMTCVTVATVALSRADAGILSAEWVPVEISPEAIDSDPALANASSWDLIVSSDNDILAIDLIVELTEGEVYNITRSGNVDFGGTPIPFDYKGDFPGHGDNASLAATQFPEIDFDSIVDMPGDVQIASSTADPQFMAIEAGDLTDDGPQTDFRIARVTTLGTLGTATADIRTDGNEQTIRVLNIPEPASAMLLVVGAAGMALQRRRRDGIG